LLEDIVAEGDAEDEDEDEDEEIDEAGAGVVKIVPVGLADIVDSGAPDARGVGKQPHSGVKNVPESRCAAAASNPSPTCTLNT
jgi:hypothetical protein